MRAAYPLIAAALASTGCSALVAASGTRLDTLTTRDEVRATFGEPEAVTARAGGGSVDHVFTRRKICEGWKGIYICMFDVWTLGLGELYLFPRESFIAARRSVVGQRLRVEYDEFGRVVVMELDGEKAFGTWHDHRPPAPADPPAHLPAPAGAPTTTGTARFR